jgi:hypothetical protein
MAVVLYQSLADFIEIGFESTGRNSVGFFLQSLLSGVTSLFEIIPAGGRLVEPGTQDYGKKLIQPIIPAF